jgi:hypothetical protein
MANLWVEEETEIIIKGKKEGLSNFDISEILEETFGDTYRVYSDSKVKVRWQRMVKKDPDLKQFAVLKGVKKGLVQTRWSPEEDKLLKTLYLEGISVGDIAKSMKQEFPNRRKYSWGTCDNRIMWLNLANRDHSKRSNMIVDTAILQSRCHPRLKVLKADNGYNVIVECLDCNSQLRRFTNTLHQKCGTCENSPDTPQDLYLIEFPDFDYPSVKIGISRDYYSLRSKDLPPHNPVLVKHTIFKYAGTIEEVIKKEFEKYRTNPHELFYNGSTECFDISVTKNIKNRIEELHG